MPGSRKPDGKSLRGRDPARRGGVTGLCDIGLIGLAAMGENLALNLERHGFSVAVFNRTTSRVDEFRAGRASGRKIKGCYSLRELVAGLRRPRRILLMVKAGQPVEVFLEQLLLLLERGDVLVDGGNSHFEDTRRRVSRAAGQGVSFVGAGISGGEEGALNGPSIMPGGAPEAWPLIKPLLQAIAARAPDGSVCCEWVGKDGAGHFVKMVHNGIEYADMQMIAEAYGLMENALGLDAARMRRVFQRWNRGELESYLIEITGEILGTRDPETGRPVPEVVLDTAGQKGTGMWSARTALELGVPAPVLTEALCARHLSALKEERVRASLTLGGPECRYAGDRSEFLVWLRSALYASKICCYAQGFHLLRVAGAHHGWDLDLGRIALLWRAGCIIRAGFLDRIREAFQADSGLPNLLLDPFFQAALEKSQPAWRKVVSAAVELGVPAPAFAGALAYYDSYRTARLPANLTQAQRDFFGAHGFERVDRPRGEIHHAEWSTRPEAGKARGTKGGGAIPPGSGRGRTR